jgi:hypothetical protein
MGLDRVTGAEPVGQITPGGSVGRCGVINASDVNGQEVDEIVCEVSGVSALPSFV